MGNNFSLDANCKALWKLNSGALTTDSISTNTLTNDGVDEDTTNKKEGTAAGGFVAANTDYLYITDANLASGFPTKSGDTTKTFSVCFWLRMTTLPSGSDGYFPINKWDEMSTPNRLSWQLAIWGDGVDIHFLYCLGYNNGESVEVIKHETPLSAETWYHVTISYQNSDKAYALRLRDESGNVIGTDVTGTATLDANKLTVNSEPIMIGVGNNSNPSFWFNGQLDEIAFFNDIISDTEATRIATGTYPETIYPTTIYESATVADSISIGLAYKTINDFSKDTNCVALYNFETANTNEDTKGGNDLSGTITTDEGDYKQGAASGYFNHSTYYGYREDADLDAGFPLKSGDTNKKISVCFWFQMEGIPGTGTYHNFVTKHQPGTANKRSFAVEMADTAKIYALLGYNAGVDIEVLGPHDTALSIYTWYHVTVTYDDSDKSWAIRIRDREGSVIGTDKTGTATNNINVEDGPFTVGASKGDAFQNFFWGLIDELVVFKDIITSDEATRIAKGNYPESVYPDTIYESVTVTEDVTVTGIAAPSLIEISIYDQSVLTEIAVVSTGYLVGSVVWGHDTDVDETNVVNLSSWIGTGTASGSGDDEIITLSEGQYMDSPDVNISGMVTLAWNKYKAGGTPTVKYKTANAQASLDAAEWTDYTDQFNSLGWVRSKIEG